MTRSGRVLALLGLAAGLGGCALTPDADQARLCRLAFVALADRDTVLTIERQMPVRGEPGETVVRITAFQQDAAGRALARRLDCRFARPSGATLDALVGLSLDRRSVSAVSLALLKRFWLATQDADAADPEPVQVWHLAPQLPPSMAHGLQNIVAALPGIAIYGFLAAAYSLVYGLIGRINLAFGALAAIGGAASLAGVGLLGPGATVAGTIGAALLAAIWAGSLHGIVVARWVLHPLRRTTGQQGLVATVGLAFVLEEYLRLAQGPSPAWMTPLRTAPLGIARAPGFTVTVTPLAFVIAAVAAVGSALLLLLMTRSQFGRNWHAMADDPTAAALLGVDPAGVLAATVALASALAASAGAVTVLAYGTFGASFGMIVGLKSLLAAVLGGIGSVPGALLGALVIALGETLWAAFFPIEYRDLALFVALSALLIMRPGGFLGFGDLMPRRV